ncbi:MAG: response regulator [Candidatus Accumulibacter meliphilus]|jgi:two-component system response regulator FixJ|uniref:response regulator transcription factor n=1 Tax=Candidatus Accumulibacter meliphilus TaxID=2211374 RepID=UPI002FC37731
MENTPQAEVEAQLPLVYIVDDEAAVRDALGLLFQSVGLAHVGFPDAQALLAHPLRSAPCCLLTDLRMPLMSGIELVETLRKRGVSMPAIIISGHGDIKQAVRALKCGAVDFIEKPFDDQDLIDSVNAALKLSMNDASTDAPAAPAEGTRPGRQAQISPRELEVLRLVVKGCPNKVIARELGISARTVEVHRAHAMQKLGASSVAELVRVVLHGGLLDQALDEPLSNHHAIAR